MQIVLAQCNPSRPIYLSGSHFFPNIGNHNMVAPSAAECELNHPPTRVKVCLNATVLNTSG